MKKKARKTSLLKTLRLKVKEWNWQNIGGFGGLLGRIGAIFAILILSLNLCVIRKQKELEFKGYLGLQITDLQKIEEDHLLFTIKLSSIGRPPLLLKGIKLGMISQNREIDADLWYDMITERMDTFENSEVFNPIFGEMFVKYDVGTGYVLDRLDSIWAGMSRVEVVGDTQRFFFHLLLKYEDRSETNYWVYSCWRIGRICTGIEGENIYFGYPLSMLDNYIYWEASRKEMIPRKLKSVL